MAIWISDYTPGSSDSKVPDTNLLCRGSTTYSSSQFSINNLDKGEHHYLQLQVES